ncbi:Mv-ORF23 peptide [Maruca vitrata nucleopolyhedrovirus]|uniref:Mv-ORF23 peptide n=1 Tax=Maruca vitrata nucleopolyhedrovirus TaxID=1307954 RepID=A1YR85_9ABAC|nr:Mv-ORF23 peptide [Maruca vitrata nucleopolyhedrovirus]ABL75975.1 Mv-ORF23 peptide [Maruca vitrata nucleopolyhedrovirus]
MTMAVNVPLPPPLIELCNRRPTPTPRFISLQRQPTSVVKNYQADVQKAIDALKQLNLTPGHLGEVIDTMGQQGKLLPEIIEADDDFRVNQTRNFNCKTIEYLNFLETDKLFRCRLCYTHADWLWCDFHRNHAYRGARNIECNDYVEHLNSDMGVVMLIEEYFYCLSSSNFKNDAKRVLRTLTKFESLSELMASYNFSTPDLDTNAYELMDFE